MNRVACESGFQRIIGWFAELATMALVTVMAIVSTLRLLGIVS